GFRDDVAAWYLASDVVALPSHVEPLGNVTLEAMSFARPVIGGHTGGIPEMVVHGQTGLLVPPRAPRALADALALLIGDAPLRARLGAEGRRRCEELFSLEAHVRSVLKEYDRVVRRETLVAPT